MNATAWWSPTTLRWSHGAEGDSAPEFELTSDAGESVRLSDFRGKPVVLYFYPRSDTPGCTRQACAISDSWGEVERRGVTVIGVSTDDERAQARFKEKYGLPFTILADPRADARRPLRRRTGG